MLIESHGITEAFDNFCNVKREALYNKISKWTFNFCFQCSSWGCRGQPCIPWQPGKACWSISPEVSTETASIRVLHPAREHQEPHGSFLWRQAACSSWCAVQQRRVSQWWECLGLPKAEEELWFFSIYSICRFKLISPVSLNGFQYVNGWQRSLFFCSGRVWANK